MPHTSNPTLDIILYSLAGLVLLILGYRIGKWIGALAASKLIAAKEQDLFTAQKSFKSLYEQELANLKQENANLHEEVRTLNNRVEEYRKKPPASADSSTPAENERTRCTRCCWRTK